MPSFLSKVFGRKKSDDKDSATSRSVRRTSDPSLLEGKFEAVPSTLSPTSPKFSEGLRASEKGKDKDGDRGRQFPLKSKSKPPPSSPANDAPHLTLRLPGTADNNEDSLAASFSPLVNETHGSNLTRRLTPVETLSLIEACSKAITERGGLETLGVMRPHWHSASPQLQRKLISLFLLSLAHKSPETTLAPSTSPLAAFNSELEYTRSVHDIAAVFRWALRHLKLEGTSFGSSSSSDEWSWYHTFSEAERTTGYDPRVFTTKLIPEITSTHTSLLLPILEIFSSLAAHAEANGYSGSKLTKYFGFWLMTSRRASGTENWISFYKRWEDSGRMFEHLFLAWLRDENTKRSLPRRLQELVAQYPYTTSPDKTGDGLLTRPRFSTRSYEALLVRVDAVYADTVLMPPSRSPVGVFTDALESEPKSDSGEHLYLWNQVKAAVTSDSEDKPLPTILSDDTINLLSLVSTDPKELMLLGIPSTASPLSPITEAPLPQKSNGNGVPIPARKPTLPHSIPQSPKDWAEFSSAGFGETTLSQDFASTLLDKDVEVTEPPLQRKPSKQKQHKSTVAPAKPSSPTSDPKPAPEEPEGPKLILAKTEVVQLDEAFIDFWRDASVDPISGDWPKFVIGELKHPLTLTLTSSEYEEKATPGNLINWIIIEEKFKRPTPPPTPVVPHETLATPGGLKVSAAPLRRTSSPRPSFGDKKTSSLSATLRRFTLFGSSKDDLTTEDTDINPTAGGSGKKEIFGRKKFGVGKSPKIGEMGETGLSEEPELQLELPQKVDEPGKAEKMEGDGKGKGEVTVVTADAVGGDPTKEEVKHEAPPPEMAEKPELRFVGVELDTLPAAPESVVSHGETPGPQLALDSTEAGLHHVPDVEEPQEQAAEPVVPPPEPVIQHLEDTVGDPAADVGVDLEPVPIIPNDLVEEPERPITTDQKTEDPIAEDVLMTGVPSAEAPPVPELEVQSALAYPIVEDEAVKGPQPVIPENPSPLPPSVPISEESVLDVPASEPASEQTDLESHSSPEEPTKVQETV